MRILNARLWLPLVALLLPALAAPGIIRSDLEGEYTKLEQQAQKDMQAFFKVLQNEKDEKKQRDLWEKQNPAGKFAADFMALADRAKGTPTEEKALGKAMDFGIQAGKNDLYKSALTRLVDNYPNSKSLRGAVSQLGWGYPLSADEAEAVLRKIAGNAKDDGLKSEARFNLAKILSGAEASDAKKGEAKTILRELGSHTDARIAGQAKGQLFELEHLQVGMVAPDFETVDENGKTWKLSDYRGKVVIVDFWGFW